MGKLQLVHSSVCTQTDLRMGGRGNLEAENQKWKGGSERKVEVEKGRWEGMEEIGRGKEGVEGGRE